MKVSTLSQHFLQTQEDTHVQAAPWAGPHCLHMVPGEQRAPPWPPSPPASDRGPGGKAKDVFFPTPPEIT